MKTKFRKVHYAGSAEDEVYEVVKKFCDKGKFRYDLICVDIVNFYVGYGPFCRFLGYLWLFTDDKKATIQANGYPVSFNSLAEQLELGGWTVELRFEKDKPESMW